MNVTAIGLMSPYPPTEDEYMPFMIVFDFNKLDPYVHNLESPYSSSYILKGIQGLDSDEIDSEIVGYDPLANPIRNFTLGKNEIILNIELNPDTSKGETMGGLRDTLYQMFMENQSNQLPYLVAFDINGVFDPLVFGDPEFKALMTGIRLQKIETPIMQDSPTVQMTFNREFPTWLNMMSETGGEDLPQGESFTIVRPTDSILPTYPNFVIYFTADAGDEIFTIYNSADPTTFSIDVGDLLGNNQLGFRSGDTLYFYFDSRSPVLLTRDGIDYPIPHKIVPGSVRPRAYGGTTEIVIDAGPNASWNWVDLSYEISSGSYGV